MENNLFSKLDMISPEVDVPALNNYKKAVNCRDIEHQAMQRSIIYLNEDFSDIAESIIKVRQDLDILVYKTVKLNDSN